MRWTCVEYLNFYDHKHSLCILLFPRKHNSWSVFVSLNGKNLYIWWDLHRQIVHMKINQASERWNGNNCSETNIHELLGGIILCERDVALIELVMFAHFISMSYASCFDKNILTVVSASCDWNVWFRIWSILFQWGIFICILNSDWTSFPCRQAIVSSACHIVSRSMVECIWICDQQKKRLRF